MNVTDLTVDLDDGRSLDVALAGPRRRERRRAASRDAELRSPVRSVRRGGERPRAPVGLVLPARLCRVQPPRGPNASPIASRTSSAIVDHLGVDRFATMGWSGRRAAHPCLCSAPPRASDGVRHGRRRGSMGCRGLGFLGGHGAGESRRVRCRSRERGCLAGVPRARGRGDRRRHRGTGRCIPRRARLRCRQGGGDRGVRRVPGRDVPRCGSRRDLGLVRRRHRVHASVGVRRLGDPGSGVGVAGRAGSDGAVRARRVVGGAHPRFAPDAPSGTRPPLPCRRPRSTRSWTT